MSASKIATFKGDNMKTVQFTKTELTTLLWAVQSKTVAEAKLVREHGGNPSHNENVRRLHAISEKLYDTLMGDKQGKGD